MEEVLPKLLLVIYLTQRSLVSAQLSLVEEQKNMTECSIKTLSINCGSSVIAIDSIILKYDVACDSTCCTFNSNHCSKNLEEGERSYVRRACSGKSSCTLDLSGPRAFCSLGLHEPSYVTIYYYCIPSDRQLPICSSTTLQSSGLPLYLTNTDYPGVTTGDSSCSCSLEVHECSSSVNLHIIDVDLYLEPSTCEQTIEIRDNSNAKLKEIKCESYYGADIVTQTLNKHYITINFLDNSVQNLEGLFFLGFSASVNSQFSLSCSTKSESRCVDCGSSFDITNGNASLTVENDSSNGARANVVCYNGFETEKETIVCTDTGVWETAECTEIKEDGENEKDDDEKADESRESGGGLSTGTIVIIVVLSIALTVVIVACCIKHICYKKEKISPDDTGGGVEIPYNKPSPGTSLMIDPPDKMSRSRLPPITPKENIKHGHVYIDHDQAHIFALTIHIPFRKPANRLEPITNAERQ